MNNKYYIRTGWLLPVLCACLLGGCKKDFLEEKRDLGGVNEEVYKDSILATAYVDYVYGLFLPPDNAQSLSWNIATNDIKFAQTTEEFPTQTSWNQTWASISYVNGHALNYFGAPLESRMVKK